MEYRRTAVEQQNDFHVDCVDLVVHDVYYENMNFGIGAK